MECDNNKVTVNMRFLKNSLKNNIFEIGEFTRDLLKDESDTISSTWIGKKVISKIIKIIENDIEDIC